MLSSIVSLLSGLAAIFNRLLGLEQQAKDEQAGAAIAQVGTVERQAKEVTDAKAIQNAVATAKPSDLDSQLREFQRD